MAVSLAWLSQDIARCKTGTFGVARHDDGAWDRSLQDDRLLGRTGGAG